MDLDDRDILQINATIIAGGLIFLTFISFSFGELPSTQGEIATRILKSAVPLAIVIWFSISSIQCIRGNHRSAMNVMATGFELIAIFAVIFLAFSYYDWYVNIQTLPVSTNQTK